MFGIVIFRENSPFDVYGPFETETEAVRILNEEPSRFGAEEDCLEAVAIRFATLDEQISSHK